MPDQILSDGWQQHMPPELVADDLCLWQADDTLYQASDPGRMEATFAILTRQAKPNNAGRKVHILPNEHGQGMRLDMHEKAPIVLFGHGFDGIRYPVGVAERDGKYTTKATASKMTSTVVFAQSIPEGPLVFGMVDEGLLRMASAGFRVFFYTLLEDKKRKTPPGAIQAWYGDPIDVVEAMLIEWSIVATGADQGALKQTLDRGHFNGEKLTRGIASVLQRAAGPKTVWSPGASFAIADDATIEATDEGAIVQSGDVAVSWPRRVLDLLFQTLDPDPLSAVEQPIAEQPDPESTPELTRQADEVSPVEPPSSDRDIDPEASSGQNGHIQAEPELTPDDLVQAWTSTEQMIPVAQITAEITQQLGEVVAQELAPLREQVSNASNRLDQLTGKVL